ncbi:hypothetical protein [Bacillus xiamenensis]|uniref:hypothetical protein n=1 Tax=Bacillus xiamenensis TaxID=1178537 RepID=UPI001FD567BF|nr:hypothetical protein [Bacillus xiamenensis]
MPVLRTVTSMLLAFGVYELASVDTLTVCPAIVLYPLVSTQQTAHKTPLPQ